MLGHRSGFAALLKIVVPDIISVHCVLHCYAFASKTLPEVLKEVLLTAVKAVNFIRIRAFQYRLFCEEEKATNSFLLLPTEVIWLSRRRVLNRVVEL